MSLLAPVALLAGLLAVPIVLLYMLRLRRREIIVSSHFLWRQVVHDTEANTPWQRLRRNLLLLLQLLILALLVLALARPAQVIETLSAGKTVLLLDATASMNATDVSGGTRLDAAKARARELIASLGPGDTLSIIRVSATTEPVIGYTGDAGALRAALEAVAPGYGGGDWATALTLAAAGAEGATNFNILVLSDGNIPAEAGRLPENIPAPVFLPIGSSGANIALSALATRTLPGQPPQLFAQVQNYSERSVAAALVVRLDGELWQSATQTLAANSQRSFIFAIDRAFTTLQAELVLPDDALDYLALDNRAFATAENTQPRRVLIMAERDNRFIEQVFRSLPGITTLRGSPERGLPTQPYDLYVFDGWLPDVLPAGNLLIINPPRDTALFRLGPPTPVTSSLTVPDRTHPLLAFVDFSSVNVRELRPISAVTWAQPLVLSDAGALLLAGSVEGYQVAVLPFDLRASDLPLQIAFPILMANALDWFAPSSVLGTSASLSVGAPVTLRPPLNTTGITITLPDGSQRALPFSGSEALFADTRLPGLYTVDLTLAAGRSQTAAFAINLFGTGESDLAPQAALALGGGERAADAEAQLSLREFWGVLALAALLLLLIEWGWYHRRLRLPAPVRAPGRSTAR